MKKTLLVLLMMVMGHGFAAISLDDAARQASAGSQRRILNAKTEVIAGRKVHIIKSLTPDGRIQYHKYDAETGALISGP